MLFLRTLLLATCALVSVANPQLLAQDERPGAEAIPISDDYILRSWDMQDGLPDLDIRNISQTPDGYLWIATWLGLTRFDGEQLTTVPEVSSLTSALLTAKDGTLWAAINQQGLARLQNGRFQVETPASSPSFDKSILALAEDSDGGIWAGCSQGGEALRWKAGKFSRFLPAESKTPISVYAAAEGVVWFTSSGSCGFFDGQQFQPLPIADRSGMRLGMAQAGGMWAVRGQQLLRLWKNGTCEIVADLSRLGGATQVTVLYEDREGNLWIGTQGVGLVRFRNGNFDRVPLPGIQCLYEDRESNLWVGTHGNGLSCLSPRRFFVHAAPVDHSLNPSGPLTPRTSSLGVDREGRVWMTQGLALVCSTDATNRVFTLAPGWSGPHDLFSLMPDSFGRIWLGGAQARLRCWQDGKYVADDRFPGSLASFLLGASPTDPIWVAAKPNKGIYERHQGGTFSLLTQASGIIDPICMALDEQKRLWVGTNEGRVYHLQGKQFVEIPMPAPKSGDMVSFLVPDGPDTVWISCVESGLHRWHAGRVDTLPRDSGLPARMLNVLEIEPNGNFWFGSPQGLFRAARSELDAVLAGRQQSLAVAAYGKNNGLPGTLAFHSGFLHSSARTPDGHLWFATTLGALEVVPEITRKDVPPRSVLIEEFLVNSRSIPIRGEDAPILIPPRPATIQIGYTLPLLDMPEQVRFRHRLQGSADEAWSLSTTLRTVTFTRLPPGNYTFEVAATDPTSIDQPKIATIPFTVRAAWWETYWFRLGCLFIGALALAASVQAVVRRRLQVRLRRLEQENALERERSRIARDMHDELGASLTRIILMSEAAADEHPIPDLDQIAEASRSVSATLDEIVWATNPRNDTLERLVNYIAEFAEEYLAPTEIALRIELPDEIPDRSVSSEKRHHMLLVVKEALNNIVKHANARKIHLRVSLQSDELHIVIKDDGQGFDTSSIAATSNGLINMRQRLVEIGGILEIESNPSHGTKVMLTVNI